MTSHKPNCRCPECRARNKSGTVPPGFKHGGGGYTAGCRCEVCSSAQSKYAEKNRAKFIETGIEGVASDPRHGKASTYTNLRCRCDKCKKAQRDRRLQLRDPGTPPRSGECDLCLKKGKVVWDHDHDTGHFRGWLCHGCNTGLGKFGDSIEQLERVVRYLGG